MEIDKNDLKERAASAMNDGSMGDFELPDNLIMDEESAPPSDGSISPIFSSILKGEIPDDVVPRDDIVDLSSIRKAVPDVIENTLSLEIPEGAKEDSTSPIEEEETNKEEVKEEGYADIRDMLPIEMKDTEEFEFIELPKSVSSENSTMESDENLLDRFVVDLNNIEIRDTNLIERTREADKILGTEAVYQVIPFRSAYIAFMQGLTFEDKDLVKSSNLSGFNERKLMYSLLHKKMANSSVGKMTFAEFLKVTAYGDRNTLHFGIYAQTYPGATEHPITCGKCGKITKIKLTPAHFIAVKDKNVFDFIKELLSRKMKPMDLIGKSMVQTSDRYLLPKTKIILEIKTPSLEDHLNLLGLFSDDALEEKPETFGSLLFIKKIFVPDLKGTKAAGKPIFSEINDMEEKLRYIRNLPTEDGDELNYLINQRERKYEVRYEIAPFPCAHCKVSLGRIPIDMEHFLFLQMSRAEMTFAKGKQKK
jgi:hypothetical protein